MKKSKIKKRNILVDLTGFVSGKLTVLHRNIKTEKRGTHWDCICECGNIVTRDSNSIKTNRTTHCGCSLSYGNSAAAHRSHGMSHTKVFKAWQYMRTRCYNKNDRSYPNYGGRGITVDNSWDTFEQFYADMGDRPSAAHTLDRVDVNGNYSKENCRWVTRKIQNRNKRNNLYFVYKEQKFTLAELAEISGINYGTLQSRLTSGWDIEKAVNTPPMSIEESAANARKHRTHS